MSAPRIETVGDREQAGRIFERVREAVGPDAAPREPLRESATALVAWRGDEPVARCAIDVVHDLHEAPGKSGLVMHYESIEAEAGVELLREACGLLAVKDVRRVLGPMNGSTWARYRLALRPPDDDPPPFLAEPWNPPRYPDDFDAAGFSVAARYESRVDEHLGGEPGDADELAEQVRAAGIGVRPLDVARFDVELERLFALSLECFADNLYYTPIDREPFRAQYEKVRPLIDPELALIAEDAKGEAVAFQFAFRDPLVPPPAPPRVVVKTVATAPRARGIGLGGHMLDLLRRRARAIGAASVIHALMHVRNVSMKMSARHRTRVFRRYVLGQWLP
jgi:GNAT superfamily N-acetyltransferase